MELPVPTPGGRLPLTRVTPASPSRERLHIVESGVIKPVDAVLPGAEDVDERVIPFELRQWIVLARHEGLAGRLVRARDREHEEVTCRTERLWSRSRERTRCVDDVLDVPPEDEERLIAAPQCEVVDSANVRAFRRVLFPH